MTDSTSSGSASPRSCAAMRSATSSSTSAKISRFAASAFVVIATAEEVDDVIGPPAEVVPSITRHTEQRGDHDRREREGEQRHEVTFAVAPRTHESTDRRRSRATSSSRRASAAGSERVLQHPTMTTMVRVIGGAEHARPATARSPTPLPLRHSLGRIRTSKTSACRLRTKNGGSCDSSTCSGQRSRRCPWPTDGSTSFAWARCE